MSLQGTLDTFALQDVLRLLASTSKTGHLRVSGSRGTGGIWVDNGAVVAADSASAGPSPSAVEVTFDLLRFQEGSFVFDTGATALDPGEPVEIGPMIDEAEALLDEWSAIEAVVPSLAHRVSLIDELPQETMPVTRERWKLIRAIGEGLTVGSLGESLGLGELAVSRVVKDLVEAGFVSVDDKGDVWPAPAPAPVVAEEPKARTEPTPRRDTPARGPSLSRPEPVGPKRLDPNERTAPRPVTPINRPSGEAPVVRARTTGETAVTRGRVAPQGKQAPPVRSADGAPGQARPGKPALPPVDDPELARQLADLGPVAAAAVAAAADAETPEEAEAALANIQGDDGEPLNRGMLLKFLSSVRT